jgi:hypothetical protein
LDRRRFANRWGCPVPILIVCSKTRAAWPLHSAPLAARSSCHPEPYGNGQVDLPDRRGALLSGRVEFQPSFQTRFRLQSRRSTFRRAGRTGALRRAASPRDFGSRIIQRPPSRILVLQLQTEILRYYVADRRCNWVEHRPVCGRLTRTTLPRKPTAVARTQRHRKT